MIDVSVSGQGSLAIHIAMTAWNVRITSNRLRRASGQWHCIARHDHIESLSFGNRLRSLR